MNKPKLGKGLSALTGANVQVEQSRYEREILAFEASVAARARQDAGGAS